MRQWLRQNSKLKKSSDNSYLLVQWTLPAYRVKQGKFAGQVTCPMAGSCGKEGGCYALQGSYNWKSSKDSHTLNYELSQSQDFVKTISSEIQKRQKFQASKGKQLVVRVHDSGDYYSLNYMMDWFSIMKANPDVLFYSYTKMVKLFQATRGHRPDNLTVIFSEGGLQDRSIGESHRHSRVFENENQLQEAGYDDASDDDKVAFLSHTGKIGLIYHGASSKKWDTQNNKTMKETA